MLTPDLTGATAVHERAQAPLHLITGFYFAFRVCITYLGFQSDPRLGSAVTLLFGGGLFVSAVVYTLGDAHFSVTPHRRNSPLRWLATYLVLTAASLFWTAASSPAIAAGYWAGMAIDVATVLLLLKGPALAVQVDALMKGFVAGTLLVGVVAWLSPTLPDLRIGHDEFLHPNNLGLGFSLAFLLAQHLASRGRRWKWAAFALAVSVLRTISKSSILALLIVELIYLLRARQISRAAKVRIGILVSLVMLAFSGLLEAYLNAYTTEGNQAETLTGRTVIWATTWLMALEHPWLGHGIYSFRVLIPSFDKFQPWHAHNELLQQFFEYGALGAAVTVGLYWSLFRSAHKSLPAPYGELSIALVLFALIRGLTDTINFGLSLPLWLFATLAIAAQQIGPRAEARA